MNALPVWRARSCFWFAARASGSAKARAARLARVEAEPLEEQRVVEVVDDAGLAPGEHLHRSDAELLRDDDVERAGQLLEPRIAVVAGAQHTDARQLLLRLVRNHKRDVEAIGELKRELAIANAGARHRRPDRSVRDEEDAGHEGEDRRGDLLQSRDGRRRHGRRPLRSRLPKHALRRGGVLLLTANALRYLSDRTMTFAARRTLARRRSTIRTIEDALDTAYAFEDWNVIAPNQIRSEIGALLDARGD